MAALLCTTAFGAPATERVVRWTTAEASKRIYRGRCPVRLIFTGTMTAARPGAFTYAWKRSDGATGPVRTVFARRRGETWRVRSAWKISDSAQGWAQLWIASERHGSPAAHFLVQCSEAQAASN